jgi:hypothetical protein
MTALFLGDPMPADQLQFATDKKTGTILVVVAESAAFRLTPEQARKVARILLSKAEALDPMDEVIFTGRAAIQ